MLTNLFWQFNGAWNQVYRCGVSIGQYIDIEHHSEGMNHIHRYFDDLIEILQNRRQVLHEDLRGKYEIERKQSRCPKSVSKHWWRSKNHLNRKYRLQKRGSSLSIPKETQWWMKYCNYSYMDKIWRRNYSATTSGFTKSTYAFLKFLLL